MNPQREDPRMQFPTSHELIYGTTGSGKTDLVREYLSEEIADEHGETWIVDPHMALPEFAGLADKYAPSMKEARRLVRLLHAEMRDRGAKLAELGVADFEAGDPRHNLPVIVVTVEEAAQVLADREVRAVMERIVQDARQVGVVARLVASSKDRPTLAAFGNSEVIRSSVANGNEFACEKAST